jgi:microcystin degradation protein MlrC
VKRVGVLGFLHESNTFLASPTTYELFERTCMTRGDELIARWRGAHHELGGFLAGAEEGGFAIVPCMATYAVPAGAIPTADYERLTRELIETVRQAMPLHGLLVSLHGSTVSEGFRDADGEFLRRLRMLVGNDLPVVVTLDLHANVSPTMIELSTATIIYRSNPHLDQRERGREGAMLLSRIFSGEAQPVQALETPPMLIEIARQYTGEQPALSLYDDLREVLTWPGILSASVAMGFYYADVNEMGVAFLAVANRDRDLARRAASWMARRAWNRREKFVADLPNPETAVRNAISSMRLPVVLMDVGDNTGGGSPADSTVLFAEIQRQGVRNALVILYDPESVDICLRAGIRSDVELAVGGKSDKRHGDPIKIRGRVRTISDGCFLETQARHGGWGVSDQGVTVVVETAEEHTVILTSNRMPPLSLEQVLSLGIHPERKALIVAKGVIAPRAAYEQVAGEIVLVDTPGVTANNPRLFQYSNRRRPLFPLEEEARYGDS